MARRRRNCRNIHGVLLLDKPQGMTSNQALQAVKTAFGACKAGHTGSLDPIATGLLPLCFGEATKLSQYLLDADKRYWAVFKLGIETTTYDTEGDVVATRPVKVGEAEVEAAIGRFIGEIEQIPPMYSAVKKGGQALYKLARQGIEVEREPRRVTIHEISGLKWRGSDEIEMEIRCTKGTYVRALAHDLGQLLGCGAHMAALRRLGVGQLDIADAYPFEQVIDPGADRTAMLMPLDQGLAHFPEVRLTSLATHYLLQGQPVSTQHGCAPGWVRLYGENGEGDFLGVGMVLDDGRVAPKRLVRTSQRV